jgi:hypothetical protein
VICPNYLPELVRLALAAVGVEFAGQLTADLPDSPMGRHYVALKMAHAELAEARGEHERAADQYASAEEGWRTFSVPQRAQALLGCGRCLMAIGRFIEAASVLRSAREVFSSLGAVPASAECDDLLARSEAKTS